MRFTEEKCQALLDLSSVLEEVERAGDTIVVEGLRDVEALLRLGFHGTIEVCSRVGVSEGDLVEDLFRLGGAIVVLTDFDDEGRRLNRRLSRLLELRGVMVRRRLRRAVGRLMAVLGVHAIEALDNIDERLRETNP